jgi:hypothetical protein
MIEGGFILVCGGVLGTIYMCKYLKKYIDKYSSKYPAIRNTRNIRTPRNTRTRNIIYVTPYDQENIYGVTPNNETYICDDPPPPYSEK